MAFVVEEGLEQGRVIPLPVGRGILGADPQMSHVALRDPMLAPAHLIVVVQPDGKVKVSPAGGDVWVDGAHVDGVMTLAPGARVRIGQTTLRLRPPRAAATAPVASSAVAHRRTVSAGLVIGWVVFGLIGLLLFRSVLTQFGPRAGASLLAAVLPAPLLIAIVLAVDRYEPEPNRVLATTFLYGATAAVLFSGILGALAVTAFDLEAGRLFEVAVVAPVVEEAVKGLAVLVVFWRLREQFNGVVDAVVYSAMVGLGFAVTENAFYYGMAALAGSDVFTQTVVVRGVLSPFAHPLFTSMFGIGLAVASEAARARAVWPILGLLCGMLLHGLWNAAAFTGTVFIAVYVLIFIPVFSAVVVAAVAASRREERLIRRHLAEDVASGLLTADEVDKLASVGRRRAAERESARLGGAAVKGRRREFHAAATRLAFLRHRRRAGAMHAATAEEEARQVEAVARAKAAAKGVSSLATSAGHAPAQ